MAHPLYTEIRNFDHWAETAFDTPEFPRGSDWESLYPDWSEIYNLFEDFLKTGNMESLSDEEVDPLLYIIGRDNESEFLADIVSEYPVSFEHLAKAAGTSRYAEAKWQLAIRLHLLPDRTHAVDLLESFVNDPDEYVNRRALLAMAELNTEKTEYYCEKFWQRQIYGEADEYQRMVVLTCLKTIQSPKLNYYLALARHDGRKFLLQKVTEIETESQ